MAKHINKELLNSDNPQLNSWFHEIELLDGTVTPSMNTLKNKNEAIDGWGWTRDLFEDKRILDIGCFNGLHTVMAYRWGAKEVIALDHVERDNMKYIIDHFNLYDQMDFDFDYRIFDICGDLENIKQLGKFDTVLFCGVFYHLIDPLLATFRIKNYLLKDNGIMLFESWASKNKKSMMEFIVESHQGAPNDYGNWWIPSETFLIEFLNKMGFELYNSGFKSGVQEARWSTHALWRGNE